MSETATADLPPTRGRRVLGSLYRISRALAIFYVGIVVVIYFLQGKLIFPGAASQGTPQATLHSSPGGELVTLTTNSGERIVAYFGKALSAEGEPLENAHERP